MNNNWVVEYIDEAAKDFNALDGSVKPVVAKAILKVSTNPSASEATMKFMKKQIKGLNNL